MWRQTPSKRRPLDREGILLGEQLQKASLQKKKSKKRRSSSSRRRAHKRDRRSRSRRSRRRSPPTRWASPVRPCGVKREDSNSAERASRRERKSRPLLPRSQSRSPPRRREERRAQPSRRPEGRHWKGPIPAHRREPPPGQGVHYQKNKGVTKRKRRAAFQANQRRYWGRR